MNTIEPIVVEDPLTKDEAEMLRAYDKLLARYRLKDVVFCTRCPERTNGTRFHVTDTHILIECRCTTRTYKGQTF